MEDANAVTKRIECTLKVEGRPDVRDPTEAQLFQVIESLTPDGGPSFLILERDGLGYAQTAGGHGSYVVEWRDWHGDDASSPLYAAGSRQGSRAMSVSVPTSSFQVTVNANECLGAEDAKAILGAYLRGEPRPETYLWCDVSERIPERVEQERPAVDSSLWTTDESDRDNLLKLQLAAIRGNPDAQYALGVRYRLGDGLPKDCVAAHRWFRAAGRQKHIAAIRDVGTMYRFGEGVEPSIEVASAFHMIAAVEGDAAAIAQLADYRVELEALALTGNQFAALGLARMCLRGIGVAKDEALSFAWVTWAHEDCAPDRDEYARREVGSLYAVCCAAYAEPISGRARAEYAKLRERATGKREGQ